MLKFNSFVFLTFIFAGVTSFKFLHLVNEIAEENPLEEAVESLSSMETKSTGSEDEAEESKGECAGGLLDFIQCVVRTKIDTFRQELSKVTFPNKQPGDFQLQTIDPEIEDSLENWIQKFMKHSTMQKENCTSVQ